MAVSDSVFQINERFRKARQASQLSGLTIGLARAASDMEEDFSSRQDYEKFSEDAVTQIGKLRQDYLDQIDDQEIAQIFMPRFEQTAIKLESGIRKLARMKFIGADQAALGTELENVQELAGRSVGDYGRIAGELRAIGRAAIMGRAASGVISHPEAQALSDQFDAKLWDNYMTAQVRSNPIETEQALSDETLFPGMDRSDRLRWQGVAADAATKRRVSDTADSLVTAYGNDFGSMYGALGEMEGLSKDERSKVLDIIETSETEYNKKRDAAITETKKRELEGVYSLVNQGNLVGALKAVEGSRTLSESEKFQKAESLKNLRDARLWSTDPELEARLSRQIDSGGIDEAGIEFHRGLGLSNATTDALKKRLQAKGKDPIKDAIVSEAASYAESRWKTTYPAKDDAAQHFNYATFENRIRSELEGMDGLTRQQAIDHVDRYFDIQRRERSFLGIDTLYPDEKFTEADRLYQDKPTGYRPGGATVARGSNIDPMTGSAGDIEKETTKGSGLTGLTPETQTEIEQLLINAGKQVTPENIKHFYELNKSLFENPESK